MEVCTNTLCPILYVEQHDKCLIHHCRRSHTHTNEKTHKYIIKRNITSALHILAGKNSTLLWFMKVEFAQFHWQASTFTGIQYIFREQE